MSYQALYRAWRPQTFADLVGQPHVKQTLSNAMQQNRLAHAYLFCGPRGTGKTSVAKLLAKAVNCLYPNGVEPCNECSACVSITSGNHVDVDEIDAASNRGVDEIRQLRDKVNYAPAGLKRKVYIVDEVHMLTTEAFNALLKTLEEPPAHALFVLATTEPHKIPGTIISRCQRFDFRRISLEEIVGRLQDVCIHQSWTYTEEALWKIAEVADGGLRDALGLLEQTAAFGEGKITAQATADVVGGVQTAEILEIIQAAAERNPLLVIERLGTWYASGKDAARIVHEVLQVLRDLIIVKLSANRNPSDVQTRLYGETARFVSSEWILQAIERLANAYMQLRFTDQPRLTLEASLLSLCAVAEQVAPALVPSVEMKQEISLQRTQDSSVKVKRVVEPTTPKSAPALNTKAPATRKLEVLQSLIAESNSDYLGRVVAGWSRVLQEVKNKRIQTYAWLSSGTPVLATEQVVVLSFASRIHRDAVMKVDERPHIEAALQEVVGNPNSILAILSADWDSFQAAAAVVAAPPSAEDDWVNAVVHSLGENQIEIKVEE